MRVDCHSHTVASDGVYEPAALLLKAAKIGLTHLAITDHDTTLGVIEAGRTAADWAGRITLIPGIEMSCSTCDREVHVLGLGVDPLHPRLVELCRELCAGRRTRLLGMLDAMGKGGAIEADVYDALRARFERQFPIADDAGADDPPRAAGRLHLARALVEHGAIKGPGKAFQHWIGNRAPYYRPATLVPIHDGVDTIRAAGGVAILAHPGLYTPDQHACIDAAADAGALGIELHHPGHSPGNRTNYLKLAQRAGLKMLTGGSDFHDDGPANNPQINLGRYHTPPDVASRLFMIAGTPQWPRHGNRMIEHAAMAQSPQP